MKLLRWIVVVFFFISTSVVALELGDIHMQSILNQPLHAVVDLTDLGSLSLDTLHVSLGTDEQFEEIGLTRDASFEHLQFTLSKNDKNEPILVITSDVPEADPIMELVINITAGQEQIEKRLTLFIDPTLPVKTPEVTAQEAEIANENEIYSPSDLPGVLNEPTFSDIYSLPVGQDAEQLHYRLFPEITLPPTVATLSPTPTPEKSKLFSPTFKEEQISWFLLLSYILILLVTYLIYRYRTQLLPYYYEAQAYIEETVNKLVDLTRTKKKEPSNIKEIRPVEIIPPSHSQAQEKGVKEESAEPLSSTPPVPPAAGQPSELDPIDEAWVYMNYGRYNEAEAVLRAAREKSPERNDLIVKLLEVFTLSKKLKEFAKEYAELPSDLKSKDPDLWSKTQEFAKQMAAIGKIEINMASLQPVPVMDSEKNPAFTQLTLAQAFLELGGTIEAREILERLSQSEDPLVLPEVKKLLESIDNKKL